MNKYKFLKISPSKKIRYLINKYKKKPYVVFLHGFMSDLEGQKPRKILLWNILVIENLQENLQKEILVNGQMK